MPLALHGSARVEPPVSSLSSHGWDRDDDGPETPLPLCVYHQTVTVHLSTAHANQIATQAPCCVAEKTAA